MLSWGHWFFWESMLGNMWRSYIWNERYMLIGKQCELNLEIYQSYGNPRRLLTLFAFWLPYLSFLDIFICIDFYVFRSVIHIVLLYFVIRFSWEFFLCVQTVLCALAEVVSLRFVNGVGPRPGIMGIDYSAAFWLYTYVINMTKTEFLGRIEEHTRINTHLCFCPFG